MRQYSLFAFLLPLITFMGCRSTSSINLPHRVIAFSEVQESVRMHHNRVQSMKCQGSISIETPELAQSGSFNLTLQKPDSILVNLQGPFGIKVGSVLVTRSDFLFYNSFANKLITGSTKKDNLSRIFHIQIEFDDLINLFAGGMFFDDDQHPPDDTRFENGQWIFFYADRSSKRQYWIDPISLTIKRIQFLDQNGTITLEQTFSNFEDVQGMEMPFLIRVVQPKTQQVLSLSYSDVLLNVESLQFTITVPQNAERIHW